MKELTIYVTSKCNLSCEECVMGKFMRENRQYEMQLSELDTFLSVTKASNYVFDMIICGGEPLLWKHLAEGVEMVYQSGTANKILIFSNAINIKNITDRVMEQITQLRISKYDCNQVNTDELLRRYPEKIRVVERREFVKLPREPMAGTIPELPADCLTPEHLFMKGKIFACPHVASVNDGKDTLPDGTKLYTPCEIGYLDKIPEILEKIKPLCMKCISNIHVRHQAEKFKKQDRQLPSL